jgi:lauroyl/myristoyl acyltransferase
MKFISTKDLYFLSVIALIKIISLFPTPRLKEFVASAIASGAYHLSKNKRRRAEKNVSDVYGHNLSEHQRRGVVKGNFCEFWKEVFSLPLSREEKAALKGVEIRGIEHLQSALNNGRGVILWESASFGRRNLAKQVLNENGFSISQVHTEHHTGGFSHVIGSETWLRLHIIKPFFESYEKQFVREIIYLPNSDSLVFTRRLMDRLKQNGVICITSDVSYGQKVIPLKFLGYAKLFPTGMISLAKISGAPIMPMFCIREATGRTNLIMECPINIERNMDRESGLENSIAGYIGLLESYIKKYPENYKGWHSVDRFDENRVQRKGPD